MANISNIENVQNLDSWDVGVTIHRTQAFPLDNSSYFTSLEAAQNFAANGATSHVGQQLFVITKNDDECFVDTYVIQNSDGLLEKIATKTVTDKLAADIKDIQDDVRGGVNYKGHINLDEKLHDSSLPKYPAGMTLAQIFGSYLNIVDASAHFVENLSLNNGWLYNVTTSAEYVTEDGISLENNDYIIIHSHSLSSVDVSALVRDNIDLIEAVQDDYVRFYQHSQLSTALSGEIDTLSSKLSSEVDALSTSLSTTIDDDFLLSAEAVDIIRGTLTEEIRILSVKLSNDIEDLSTNLSTDLSALSAGISADLKALSVNLSTDIDALSSSLSTTVNSNYIHISGDSNVGTLQISSDLSVVNGATFGSDSTATKVQINNDGTLKYTIDNNNVHKEEFDIAFQSKGGVVALTSDVEDLSTSLSSTAHKEVEDLSTSLSSSVNGQFVHLSGDVINGSLDIKNKLSVESYVTFGSDDYKYVFSIDTHEGKIYTCEKEHDNTPLSEIANDKYQSHEFQNVSGIIAHVKDVEDLSTSLSTSVDDQFILSAEAVDLIRGTLLEEIDALSNDISDNRNAIVSNDNDINYLSAQLSTVADDHYYKTLSAIYNDGPDNLLVTDHGDELEHKDYVMLFKYGTLVLSSIN